MNIEIVDNPAAMQLAYRILAGAVHQSAAAIRMTFESDSASAAIDYLLSGEWVEQDRVQGELYPRALNRFKLMAGLEYWRADIKQTGRIVLTMDEKLFEFNVTFEKRDGVEEMLAEATELGPDLRSEIVETHPQSP